MPNRRWWLGVVKASVLFAKRFYFPEDTLLYGDTIVRTLFAAYYLPILCCLLAAMGGFLLNMTFTLMIPLLLTTHLPLSSSSAATISTTTTGTAAEAANHSLILEAIALGWTRYTDVLARIVPFATLGLSGLAVASKVINTVGEAMVDSFTRCQGKDYPLAASRLDFLLESTPRRCVLAGTTVVCSGALGYAVTGHWKEFVDGRDGAVLFATCFITVTEVAFVLCTVLLQLWRRYEFRRSWSKSVDLNTSSSLSDALLKGDDETAATRTVPCTHTNNAAGTGKGAGTGGTLRRKGGKGGKGKRQVAGGDHTDYCGHMESGFSAPLHPAEEEPQFTGGMTYDGLTFVSYWWRRYIGRIRFTAIELLCACFLFWAATRGPLDAISFFAETLMYLNVPHLFGFGLLAVATGLNRNLRTLRWSLRHGRYLLPAAIIASPYHVLLLYAVYMFQGQLGPVVVLSCAAVWHWIRAVELCQEFHCRPSSRNVHWMYEKAAPVVATNNKVGGSNNNHKNNNNSSGKKTAEWRDVVTTTSSSQQLLKSPNASAAVDSFSSSSVGAAVLHDVPMHYATIFEDAFERGTNPMLVSLDVAVDFHGMRLYTPESGTAGFPLIRKDLQAGTSTTSSSISPAFSPTASAAVPPAQWGCETNEGKLPLLPPAAAPPSETSRRRRSEGDATTTTPSPPPPPVVPQRSQMVRAAVPKAPLVAVCMLPRILSLQSRGSYSGAWFHHIRVIIRAFGSTSMMMYACLLCGVFLQATVPALQPRVMTANATSLAAGGERLHVDHFVSHLVIDSLIPSLDEGDRSRGTPTNIATTAGGGSDDVSDDTYGQLCRGSYGGGVHTWELALHSIAAYCTDSRCLETILSYMNRAMDLDWELVAPAAPSASSDADVGGTREAEVEAFMMWRGFLELHSKRRNTTVIAIRGTDPTSLFDYLQDVDLFFDVALYHIVCTFVPGTSLLPSPLATDFMRISAFVEEIATVRRWCTPLRAPATVAAAASEEHAGKEEDEEGLGAGGGGGGGSLVVERHYYKAVLRHLERSGLLDEGMSAGRRNLVFTGHSLGGYLSHILGAKVGRKAMAFSSPGLVLSHKKYGITAHQVHATAVNVIPTHDILPHLGWQGGQVHHIECDHSTRELCHAMEATAATLFNSCASARRRFPFVANVSGSGVEYHEDDDEEEEKEEVVDAEPVMMDGKEVKEEEEEKVKE